MDYVESITFMLQPMPCKCYIWRGLKSVSPETAIRQFSHFNVAGPKVAGNKGLFGGAFEAQDNKIEFSYKQGRF
jgi:hypothetical protein